MLCLQLIDHQTKLRVYVDVPPPVEYVLCTLKVVWSIVVLYKA